MFIRITYSDLFSALQYNSRDCRRVLNIAEEPFWAKASICLLICLLSCACLLCLLCLLCFALLCFALLCFLCISVLLSFFLSFFLSFLPSFFVSCFLYSCFRRSSRLSLFLSAYPFRFASFGAAFLPSPEPRFEALPRRTRRKTKCWAPSAICLAPAGFPSKACLPKWGGPPNPDQQGISEVPDPKKGCLESRL